MCVGGNVGVGREDSLTIGSGTQATSIAGQISMIRGVLTRLGFKIATLAQVRQMLRLQDRGKRDCSGVRDARGAARLDIRKRDF
ncbi:hypothetical protein LMG28140_02305 [Paraburkholderia metrosideri]|uniref:Uncharacterized protein n=2 Tax=Paraburkholderia metrosideri TaxID=580937 RepID=A0ABN7HRS9_9BURK|nr:hypothetical protein LMG28140_02305 [Paraburkholderia metrosideri]